MTKVKKESVQKMRAKPAVPRDKVTKAKSRVPNTSKAQNLRAKVAKTSVATQSNVRLAVNESATNSSVKTKNLRVTIPKTPVASQVNAQFTVTKPSPTSSTVPCTPKAKQLRVKIFKTPIESLKNARFTVDDNSSTIFAAPNTPKTKKLRVQLPKSPMNYKRQNELLHENPVAPTPFSVKCISRYTSTPLENSTRPRCSSRSLKVNPKYKNFVMTLKPNKDQHLSENSSLIESKVDNKNTSNEKSQKSSRSDKRTRNGIKLLPNPKNANANKENEPTEPVAEANTVNEDEHNIVSRRLEDKVSRHPLDVSCNLPVANRRNGLLNESEATSNMTGSARELTLLKQLRHDWTATSLEETQSHSLKNSSLLSLRKTKRHLTPLVETIPEDCSMSNEQLPVTCNAVASKDDSGDEAYSSSEEFEAIEEKENISSKRAPTWEKLSSKSLSNALSDFSSQVNVSNVAKTNAPIKEADVRKGEGETVANPTIIRSPKEKANKPGDKIGITVSPPTNSRNLRNNSDLIEEILSSSVETDDIVDTSLNSCTSKGHHTTNNPNCTKKFFVSRLENTTASKPKEIKASQGRRTRAKKRKQEQVYEFLSQSSSEGNDPVADVIKKMIETGKVTVAKHKKGTGKSALPRMKRKTRKQIRTAKEVSPKPIIVDKPNTAVKTYERIEHEHHLEDEPVRDQRGFSELARSAMLKEADKNGNTSQRRMITDKKRLLEMAQKFVGQSTPIRVTSPGGSTYKVSPRPGSASPWRVDDDKLPQTFYFSRNSDNLPSFSSDHIPSTPPKRRPKSVASSYSSNDSNGENVAPLPANENQPVASHPTSRRALTLSHRSPLKAINILDVVDLPPLALNNFNVVKDAKKKPQVDKSQQSDSILNNKTTNQTDKTNKTRSDDGTVNNTNLFGFEEFIDESDDDGLSEISIDPSTVSNKEQLKERLQRLKRLRPSKPVTEGSKNARINPVFDNNHTKQKTIQEMLCSTMIEGHRESQVPRRCVEQESNKHDHYFDDGYNVNLSGLFKDPEPETSFNPLQPRRTYSRPFRKKRKLRHNFVMFMDSDESGDDNDQSESFEKKTKKRTKKNVKENAELNKFVDEFNEMCKEVTQYELIVE